MIEVKDVSIRAGEGLIGPISIRVESGSHCVLEGSTGSGKTSLIEAIAGLRSINGGMIALHGVDVTRHRPADRYVGYVPQDSVLFSKMTVKQNLSFGLRVARRPSGEVDERVQSIAEALMITDLLGRSTGQLSGGERQRVSLGRALVMRPDVLLLDEPLSAVDQKTRTHLEGFLTRWQSVQRSTILHVSHSYVAGALTADRVIDMQSLFRSATDQRSA